MLIVVTALGLTLVGVTPSSAATKKPKKPEVSLTAPATAKVGKALQIKSEVKRGATGQKLTLQRKVGGTWVKVAKATLPQAGKHKKTVTFTITPAAAGTVTYRASLAKKKETKAATSKTIRVVVTKPAVPPTPAVTLSTSTSTTGAYGSEQTKVTFSGTVTGVPAGESVQIQFSRGRNPAPAAWSTGTTATTTGDASPVSYSGTVTIPVVREGVEGAPQLNLRAVVGSSVSPMRSYLIRTRYDGIYVMYDENNQIVGEDSFQVFYSDKAWQMYFGALKVTGTTDGWDLVDKGGLRFEATLNGLNNDGLPSITYVASFSTDDGPRRINGTATFR